MTDILYTLPDLLISCIRMVNGCSRPYNKSPRPNNLVEFLIGFPPIVFIQTLLSITKLQLELPIAAKNRKCALLVKKHKFHLIRRYGFFLMMTENDGYTAYHIASSVWYTGVADHIINPQDLTILLSTSLAFHLQFSSKHYSRLNTKDYIFEKKYI